MSLVFVPLAGDELRTWAADGNLPGPVAAFAVTPGLLEAFMPADEEDAERVALLVASVASLGRSGRRLVAVAEAPVRPRPGGDADFGEVLVDGLAWDAVTSLFADERGLDVASAAAAARAPLAAAWEQPEVQVVVADADLLWYGPGEWRQLVAG